MALARSASGPGGLSINTGAANTLFGAASQPPPSGGLFGSASTSKPGGLFGSTATTSAPQTQSMFGASSAAAPSGGLFGSATTATSGAQTGGLFGSSTATSQAPGAGGLFGSTSTSQPAQTGGLFGSTPAVSQPAQTGGLFGSATGTSQAQQSGGLFGPSTTSQPQQTGGLFGNIGTTTTSQPQSTSLFGQTTTATGASMTSQPAPLRGIFGNTSLFDSASKQQQTGSAFSLNKPASQTTTGPAQTVIPGVRIDVTNLRTTTRFNDLAEDLQREFEVIDKFILTQMQFCHDCTAIIPSHGDQLDFVPENVEFLARKQMGLETSLSSDLEAVALLNKLLQIDAENARLSFRVIENLKLPPQFHNSGIWHSSSTAAANASSTSGTGTDQGTAQDLVSFFSKTADEMSETLTTYQRSIKEVEQHMRGLEMSMGQAVQNVRKQSPAAQLGELAAVFKDFEMGILGVAGQVGEAREKVQQLQLGGFGEDNESRHKTQGQKPRRGVY